MVQGGIRCNPAHQARLALAQPTWQKQRRGLRTMNSNRIEEIDLLYREAVVLADRARGWFDGPGIGWRAGLPAAAQAAVATESLATTARLMAAIAWLLDPAHSRPDADQPAYAFASDTRRLPPPVLAGTPAMALVTESRRLVGRVLALAPDTAMGIDAPDMDAVDSPAPTHRFETPDAPPEVAANAGGAPPEVAANAGGAPPEVAANAGGAPIDRIADVFTTTKGLWRA
jgi:regulator of CtrA degradation